MIPILKKSCSIQEEFHNKFKNILGVGHNKRTKSVQSIRCILNIEICNYKKIDNYKKNIKTEIVSLLQRKRKTFIKKPTVFGINSKHVDKLLKHAHSMRQLQMKEGQIGQIVLGNFPGWEDLRRGHKSGLDIRKKDNSIVIELKNKYNTCNSGSRKAVLDKLSEYKKKYYKTKCIWGIINPKNKKKLHKKIIHNNVEIEKIQGTQLFSLVLSLNGIDYSKQIIKYVNDIIKELLL